MERPSEISMQTAIDRASKESLREAAMWLGSFVASLKETRGVPWALSVFAAWSTVMTYHILEGRMTAMEAAGEEKKAVDASKTDVETAKQLLEIIQRYDLQRKVELGDVN